MARLKPPSSLDRGKVYCLESFQCLLKWWLEDEVRRHMWQQIRRTTGRRVQPSRTAKHGITIGDYTLSEDDFNQAFKACNDLSDTGDKDVGREVVIISLYESVLRTLTECKAHLNHEYQPPLGVKHACSLAELDCDCAQLDGCAHGIIESAMKAVPARTDNNLKWRLRREFEELAEKGKHAAHSKELQTLRKPNVLKKRVLSRIDQLRTESASQCDAPMLPSPSLGIWNGKTLPREDLEAQTVECLGLKFAVDICKGSDQCRILML